MVGTSDNKPGKSAGVVSNLVKKRCSQARLMDITKAIENGSHPNVLRIIEDGLFSGTEMRAIFQSLLGKREDGRQKVPKLTDPTILSRVPVQLHFGAVCDYGEMVLRAYFYVNSLSNIHIAVSAAAKRVHVLGPVSGDEQCSLDDDSENSLKAFKERLQARVTPYAFKPENGIRDMERARNFCQDVGEQLWAHYFKKAIAARPNFQEKDWPSARMKRCGLGMDGLGLTFAFPHSVPRASLPILWASGPVSVDGRSLDWMPLFPNADLIGDN